MPSSIVPPYSGCGWQRTTAWAAPAGTATKPSSVTVPQGKVSGVSAVMRRDRRVARVCGRRQPVLSLTGTGRMRDGEPAMTRGVRAAALVVALLQRAGVSRAIECCRLGQPVRQSDGSIISSAVEGLSYFGVSRTTPEGAPDPTFGVDGVTAPIEDLPSTTALAVAVLPDDKIIAIGHLFT